MLNRIVWRIKELISSLIPLALVGALLYGGFTLYKQGAFRRGIGPAVSSILYKMPYFGSRFKHYQNSHSSYAVSSSSKRKHLSRPSRKRHSRGRVRHHR